MNNMDIIGVRFERPSSPLPIKMMELVDGKYMKEWEGSGQKVTFPIRTIEVLLRLLNEGFGENISIIEWVNLFDSKGNWDQLHSEEEVNQTTVNIVKAIVLDPNLVHLALFRAALSIENDTNQFPEILIQNLHLLEEYIPSDREKEAVRILVSANKNDFKSIARMSLLSNKTPGQLLAFTGLARCTNLYKNICLSVNDISEEITLPIHEGWIVSTLGELTDKNRILFINSLITGEASLKNCDLLVTWLTEHCHPSIENTIWFKINENTKATLRKYIEINNFCNVEQLVRLLLLPKVIDNLDIDETTQKQIKSRDIFWSHYQESILSIRIIIPDSTFAIISRENFNPDWLEIFEEENASTEIVIIEFKSHIIVEFFRGRASEIRVFNKNSRNENLLLKEKKVRIDTIRKLFEDGVHDHMFLWQWACEKWLRENYKILPDSHITRFKGLPSSACNYSHKTGLPTPSQELLENRRNQLEQWNTDFFDYESQIKDSNADSLKTRQLTTKARQAKDLGITKLMCEYLEAAAKLGDIDSIEKLYNWLLKKPMGTEQERLAGDYWLNIYKVYQGERNISKITITVAKRKNGIGIRGISERPIRKIEGGRIGVNYKGKIYPLYYLKKLQYWIYLDSEALEPEACPVMRSSKGLILGMDD